MTTMTMTRPAGRETRNACAPDVSYDEEFTKAYEAHRTKVFAFVYSRVRDVDLAQDLVSAVFERAFVKGREVREHGAYAAWLFMIAKNVIAGHFRKTSRDQRHLERAGEELRFVDEPLGPEERLVKDERAGELMRQVRMLPVRDQDLLSLKFDAELTNSEIGDVMGLSALNVRVAIFRALKRLKNKMEAASAAEVAA